MIFKVRVFSVRKAFLVTVLSAILVSPTHAGEMTENEFSEYFTVEEARKNSQEAFSLGRLRFLSLPGFAKRILGADEFSKCFENIQNLKELSDLQSLTIPFFESSDVVYANSEERRFLSTEVVNKYVTEFNRVMESLLLSHSIDVCNIICSTKNLEWPPFET